MRSSIDDIDGVGQVPWRDEVLRESILHGQRSCFSSIPRVPGYLDKVRCTPDGSFMTSRTGTASGSLAEYQDPPHGPINPNLDSSVLICRVPNRDVVHREARKCPAPATAVEVGPPWDHTLMRATPKHEAREGSEKKTPVAGKSLAVSGTLAGG